MSQNRDSMRCIGRIGPVIALEGIVKALGLAATGQVASFNDGV